MVKIHDTKYGPQPIRDICWQRGLTFAEFAYQTGVQPSSHVRNAMIGLVSPSEKLRERASDILQTPVENLFTAVALASRPQGGKARGPKPRTQPVSEEETART